MAKARLAGMTVQESAIYALKKSPAQDFEGDFIMGLLKAVLIGGTRRAEKTLNAILEIKIRG